MQSRLTEASQKDDGQIQIFVKIVTEKAIVYSGNKRSYDEDNYARIIVSMATGGNLNYM